MIWCVRTCVLYIYLSSIQLKNAKERKINARFVVFTSIKSNENSCATLFVSVRVVASWPFRERKRTRKKIYTYAGWSHGIHQDWKTLSMSHHDRLILINHARIKTCPMFILYLVKKIRLIMIWRAHFLCKRIDNCLFYSFVSWSYSNQSIFSSV